MEVVNELNPIKIRKVKGLTAPYMNGELGKAINVKNMLKRKLIGFVAKKTGSGTDPKETWLKN